MLSDSLRNVSGIGEQKEKHLSKLGLYTVGDLLRYYPRDYEDRSVIKDISDLEDGETVSICAAPTGRIMSTRLPNKRSIQKVTVADDTGSITLIWFNRDYLPKSFNPHCKYIFFGKVRRNGNKIEMADPIYEPELKAKLMQKIVPVYHLTARVSQKMLQTAMQNAGYAIDCFDDNLPEWLREKYNLCDIKHAIRNIHFPESFEEFAKARKRLAFEELFMLQMGLAFLKAHGQANQRPRLENTNTADFEAKLPFELTNAQRRAISEIAHDMGRDIPMRRLVQGDVGCGKTLIAAAAIHIAVQSNGQAVMMAPTEILAQQHQKVLSKYFNNVVLLSGKLTAKAKREALCAIKDGSAKVIVGTHALLQGDVEFSNLELIVTDEQHRFGVAQRKSLESKGTLPHLLVMTATPIPRTLALILYGDLDVSVIDEMPPGRQNIKTYAVDENYRSRINEFIYKEVASGRQVYIVCPLVAENETLDLKSAEELSKKLSEEVFPDLKVGLLHGKMKQKNKNDIMQQFVDGYIDILVSTTVIEVGVDVPNATLMVIENGERFGLSQLHQLRGRVGRGQEQSHCVIFVQSGGEITRQRMDIMSKSNDGFKIAEKDLELRGPGEFFGTRQHGIPELQIANLYTDIALFKLAGEAAVEMAQRGIPAELQRSLYVMLDQKFTG